MYSVNKIIFIVLFLAAFFSVYSTQPDFYTIDAVSSASLYRSFQIVSGKIYENKAELYWRERWTGDKVIAYQIKWGIQDGIYTDTLNLLDKLRPKGEEDPDTNWITLPGLTPGTAYYCETFRDYNRDPYYTKFRFNTPPLERYSARHFPERHHVISSKVNNIEIYSLDGRKILQNVVDGPVDLSAISSARRLSGLYIVSYKNDSKIIQSEKIMIGN